MRRMIASADGCRSGWLVAVSPGWPCRERLHLYICRDFRGLLELTSSCDAVAIDIPIGLPEGSERRVCDMAAKDTLGKDGRDRVFYAPPREALKSRTPEAFQRLCRKFTGKGAGYPVWGLVPKLREVDKAMTPELQRRVIEYHPELAWHRLAGRTLESKHTEKGILQRQKLFRGKVRGLKSIVQWPARLGRAGRLDDVLDATIGLAVAEDFRSGCTPPRRLPTDRPPTDIRGLRMEIWF